MVDRLVMNDRFPASVQPAPTSFVFRRPRMPVRHWQAALLALVVLCGVGGCGGNYKFNDSTYRPLGDPQAANRGK
jgi:hypothetical protein